MLIVALFTVPTFALAGCGGSSPLSAETAWASAQFKAAGIRYKRVVCDPYYGQCTAMGSEKMMLGVTTGAGNEANDATCFLTKADGSGGPGAACIFETQAFGAPYTGPTGNVDVPEAHPAKKQVWPTTTTEPRGSALYMPITENGKCTSAGFTFTDCYATAPSTFSIDNGSVHIIHWSGWGSPKAVGLGAAHWHDSTSSTALTVTLSAPGTCGGVHVYTHLVLVGQAPLSSAELKPGFCAWP